MTIMASQMVRRSTLKLTRSLVKFAAIAIFVYSVWFYVSGRSEYILESPKTPSRAAVRHHRELEEDAGRAVPKDMLFNSDNSDAKDDSEDDNHPHAEGSHGNDPPKPTGNPVLSGDISEGQRKLNYISENLKISLSIVRHGSMFQIHVNMQNNGEEDIERAQWYIVMCHMQHGVKNKNVNNPSARFSVRIVDGNIFILTPGNGFEKLAPQESFSFHLGVITSSSDIMGNWYVAENDLKPRIIQSTMGKFEPDFSNIIDPGLTPEKRFQLNMEGKAVDLKDSELHVIPTPRNITYKHQAELHSIGLWSEWVVLYTLDVKFEGRYLAEELGNLQVQNYDQEKKFIQITTGQVKNVPHTTHNESYRLFYRPSQQSITIIGATPSGAFYGVQTFLALISKDGKFLTEFPEFSILDHPRFPYRGLMVDVARAFVSKADILSLLDTMAMYKLNKFHFHLTDDQGWRLEIPGLEELTQIGSLRTHDMAEISGLHPYFGAGPHGNTAGSGYYTVEDYQEILRHAAKLHIQVIPEIDFPGHSHAAIRSMEARTAKMTKAGASLEDAMKYSLKDPKDYSKYVAVNGFLQTTINPCMNSTFNFLELLVTEIQKMHKTIQPLNTLHVGGDEVPADALVQSPICQKFYKENPQYHNTQELKKYFMVQASMILGRKDLSMQIWEDGIYGDDYMKTTGIKPLGIKPQIWKAGPKSRIYDLAKNGFQVILSEGSHLYLDHRHESHIEERGFFWAASSISSRKIFSYRPLAESGGVNSRALRNILGMETALWGETIRDTSDLHAMIFPRLLAFAERAWHAADWEAHTGSHVTEEQNKSWDYFTGVLVSKDLHRLEAMGIDYYLPPPGLHLSPNGKVQSNTAFPGLVVQISTDRGQTWNDHDNTQTLSPGNVAFATRSHNGKRRSRSVWIKIHAV